MIADCRLNTVVFSITSLPAEKMNILAQLIEGFPTSYGSWNRTKENSSILLEPQHVRSSRETFLFSLKKVSVAVIF